jgi:hypothetical protein
MAAMANFCAPRNVIPANKEQLKYLRKRISNMLKISPEIEKAFEAGLTSEKTKYAFNADVTYQGPKGDGWLAGTPNPRKMIVVGLASIDPARYWIQSLESSEDSIEVSESGGGKNWASRSSSAGPKSILRDGFFLAHG